MYDAILGLWIEIWDELVETSYKVLIKREIVTFAEVVPSALIQTLLLETFYNKAVENNKTNNFTTWVLIQRCM